MMNTQKGGRGMMPFTLTLYNGNIELTCDKCGHVNHWPQGIELEEVLAEADDHECEGE
jgi:hypothetical protein